VRRLVPLLLALVVVAGAAARPEASPRRGKIVFAAGQPGREELFAATSGRSGVQRLTHNRVRDADPAWSPDGTRVAFVRGDDLAVLNADGTGFRRLTKAGADSDPAWAPRSTRIAFVRSAGESSTIRWVDLRSGREERFPWSSEGQRDPAWSRQGRLAYAGATEDGTSDLFVVAPAARSAKPLAAPGDDIQPAWSPDGRSLAFSSNRAGTFDIYVMRTDALEARQLTTGVGDETSPVWSPDGTRLAFVADGRLTVVRADGSGGVLVASSAAPQADPDWRMVPTAIELLPDLDQRAPRGLVLTAIRGRIKLGFTSATDVIGRGPMRILGRRPSRRVRSMRGDQLIELAGGGLRVERDVARVRYTWSSSHSHWHVLRFQTYELRRADDFRLVVRDRKSGFCLADHYGFAARRVQRFRGPRFLGHCGPGRPDLLSVSQGTSIGYTDRYPAHFHGQNVDITGVAAGLYVLVHRANPTHLLRELRYDNNAASALIRIAWPNGRRAAPSVRVLRYCERVERCGR
jgi:hypothetical protein